MSEEKFLLLTIDFPPDEGGVARYLASLASHYSDQVEIVCERHERERDFDSTAAFPIFRRSLISERGFLRWKKALYFLMKFSKRYKSIIVSHVLPIGTAAFIAKKITRVPYIVIVHGMDVRLAQNSMRKKIIAKAVLKNAKLVVANSQALANEITDVFGVREVLVIYPCIEKIVPVKTKIKVHEFRLLTVSRLVERKGHLCTLNALSLLKQNGRIGNIKYDIVGSGPFEATLKYVVDELGLDEIVKFHGNVSDVERDKFYASSDLFLMPVSNDSVDKEGFGLVFIEAASNGLPAISTKIPGVDEAILDQKSGILLENQSPQELAQIIYELSNNAIKIEEFSLNAREHASKFTCASQMEKLRPYL
jgi:phosphatidylinositol alpha-1,6-mannosyltransferase